MWHEGLVPRPGIEPASPALEDGFLDHLPPLDHQESPYSFFKKLSSLYSFYLFNLLATPGGTWALDSAEC